MTSDTIAAADWVHVKVTQNYDAKQASWTYQVYFDQNLEYQTTHQSPRNTLTEVKVFTCHDTQTCDGLKVRNVKYTTSASLCDWPEFALSNPNELCGDENAVYTGCGGQLSCSNVTDCTTDSCTDNDPDASSSEGFCVCKEGYRFDGDECVTDDANSCPVDDDLTEWTGWSSCSASCGGGVKIRTRICLTKKCSSPTDDAGKFLAMHCS